MKVFQAALWSFRKYKKNFKVNKAESAQPKKISTACAESTTQWNWRSWATHWWGWSRSKKPWANCVPEHRPACRILWKNTSTVSSDRPLLREIICYEKESQTKAVWKLWAEFWGSIPEGRHFKFLWELRSKSWTGVLIIRSMISLSPSGSTTLPFWWFWLSTGLSP